MSFFGKIASQFGMQGNSGPAVRNLSPQEAQEALIEGKAVLIDVREPDEWADTGVAKPALLIPLGELGGEAGQKLVAENVGKEFIFYCRSGGRSAAAARAFARQGLPAANAGGFSDWEDSGLPVRKV